jgi:hypothetical protein
MCNHDYSFLAVLFLSACILNPVPNKPIPNDDIPIACENACKNLKRLDCPGWKGTPGKDEVFGTDDDISCTTACIDIVNSDPSVTLNQNCVAVANSCKEVDDCFTNK